MLKEFQIIICRARWAFAAANIYAKVTLICTLTRDKAKTFGKIKLVGLKLTRNPPLTMCKNQKKDGKFEGAEGRDKRGR